MIDSAAAEPPALPLPSPLKAAAPCRTGWRRVAAVAASVALLTSVAASAKSTTACYSKAEFDAEQALRLHSELMVVGLTCQGGGPNGDLFAKYAEFTTRHHTLLISWERTLIEHYRAEGAANPTGRLDELRTQIANEIARRAELLTPTVYCGRQAAFVVRAMTLSDDDLRRQVADETEPRVGARPPCHSTQAPQPAAP